MPFFIRKLFDKLTAAPFERLLSRLLNNAGDDLFVLKHVNYLLAAANLSKQVMITVPFGSVWWVKEQLWQGTLPMHDPFSNRDGHPGLSAWRYHTPLPEYQRVPLLLGVTKPKKAKNPISFVLNDMNKPCGYQTWFLGKAAPIPARCFRTKAVRPHTGTPQLGAQDLTRFDAWCRKKGL